MDGGLAILSDTTSAFGHVFRTVITDKRRGLLKAKLPEDFKILTSDKCDPTPTSLLGDMGENSKKVSETEKLTAQMDKAKVKTTPQRRGSNRGGPYYRGDSRRGGRKYDNQKRSYDRKDDRGGRGNSRQSFSKGGHYKK